MSGLLAGERGAHRRGEGKEKRGKEGERENMQKQASAGREQRERNGRLGIWWRRSLLPIQLANFLYSLLVSDYGANISLLYAVS